MSGRGFGGMDPAKQREIARKGGVAAHAQGRAHEFTSDEAREAGIKGGLKVSRDTRHMAEIGRRGGRKCGQTAKNEPSESLESSGSPGLPPAAS